VSVAFFWPRQAKADTSSAAGWINTRL